MNPIHEFGIQVILALQGLGDWLVTPMRYITLLGHERFFMLALSLLYWSVNATMGQHLGVLLMISLATNGLFKLAFHAPRPTWLDPAVKAFAEETSFGIPSGHLPPGTR